MTLLKKSEAQILLVDKCFQGVTMIVHVHLCQLTDQLILHTAECGEGQIHVGIAFIYLTGGNATVNVKLNQLGRGINSESYGL